VASRKSNLGPVSIASFTVSVWDDDKVGDIQPPSQTGNVNINPGEKVVLTWTLTGATSVSISDGSGPVQNPTVISGDQIALSPSTNTTYTLTAAGTGGPATSSVSVTVNPPPVISSFTTSSNNLLAGQSAKLNWSVTNAKALTLYAWEASNYGKPGDQLFGTTDVTGRTSISVSPASSAVFQLVASYFSDGGGAGGTPNAAVEVQVTAIPASVVTLNATKTSIVPGASSTLSWSITNSNYLKELTLWSVDASHPAPGVSTNVTSDADYVVSPSLTTTYALVATNVAGTQFTSNAVTLTVTTCPAPTIAQFTASPASTATGTSVKLTAVFDGGVDGDPGTATIDNGVGAVTSGNPMQSPALTSGTDFTLTVSNHCGAKSTDKTRVPVGSIDTFFDSRALSLNFFGMASDGKGSLYATTISQDSGCIYKINSSGSGSPWADGGDPTCYNGLGSFQDGPLSAAQFHEPYGIVTDSSGNLYVADSKNHAIRFIDSTNLTVSTLAGDPPYSGFSDGQGTNALFDYPKGIALDAQGTHLYVSDTQNNVIRIVDLSGNVVTIAGAGPTLKSDGSGYQDGIGRNALFNKPLGITLAPDGNLYVADVQNNVIRKITLPGAVVTTIAGQAGHYGYVDGPGAAALFAKIQAITSDAEGNLYVPDISYAGVSPNVANYVIRRLRPQSDGNYWVDTIIGDAAATSFLSVGGPLPLPGDFKINADGIYADPGSGKLNISVDNNGIFRAPY
jgi:hypothetical protein